jgi:hypothetical protein
MCLAVTAPNEQHCHRRCRMSSLHTPDLSPEHIAAIEALISRASER